MNILALSGLKAGASRVNTTPIEQVKSALSRFPFWKLHGATAYGCEDPDITNPSGYYDRWVILKYKTWFGIEREKILYFEQTAFDERRQQAALTYTLDLLQTIQAF